MAFQHACNIDDLWEGEMESVEVNGTEVLLVWPSGGELTAYQAMCPHQEVALIEGKFDGRTLICRAHNWVFDARTGQGMNPSDCTLARYPLRVDGDGVLIDLDIEVNRFAHT